MTVNQITINPKGPIKGQIKILPDKSISHRAVMLSAIARGTSRIQNFLFAQDTLATVNAIRSLGITIETEGDTIVVNGQGLYGLQEAHDVINCGNSGTTCRILSGILAGQKFNTFLTGDVSLRNRPMKRIIDPLTLMGAHIEYRNTGFLPLMIKGGSLIAIDFISPIASAQVKSSILFAALFSYGQTSVTEPAKSRDHTERMLKSAGIDIQQNRLTINLNSGKEPEPFDMIVPGDFSSAAFFIAAATIVNDSELLIKNVGINPTRTGLIDILTKMGARLGFENEHEINGEPIADIFVQSRHLKGIEIDGELLLRAIDEFPILCVLASVSSGRTIIRGASELRVKESDRIHTMATELIKMGAVITELEDSLIIDGVEILKGSKVHSYGDHRVAMALAIAAHVAKGKTIIDDIECVNTSFPGFFKILQSL